MIGHEGEGGRAGLFTFRMKFQPNSNFGTAR